MPQHAAQYIKTLLAQHNPRISVQKMCDDNALPKSTIDKFLAGQTSDTSWFNVMTMVKYLGGSLDQLADIQTTAVQNEMKVNPTPAADSTALHMIVESYRQEILRNEANHQDTLERFRRLNLEAREALVDQHKAESSHIREKCEDIVEQQKIILDKMEKGRNFWRILSCCLIALLVLVIIWLVWEFANFEDGLTGHFLRMLMQSLSGGEG